MSNQHVSPADISELEICTAATAMLTSVMPSLEKFKTKLKEKKNYFYILINVRNNSDENRTANLIFFERKLLSEHFNL